MKCKHCASSPLTTLAQRIQQKAYVRAATSYLILEKFCNFHSRDNSIFVKVFVDDFLCCFNL